ncbi:dTDP-4-dehydrorhamnose reductase [Caloramator quimbayensis]|uniref:dTDP-4-dehydrorhamnose reductase n=1 Tax=Caloramator quimbayensis TaxID=1147123 RepID=A0A1T4WPX8_9CLOT|nr:NAD(P)-dependent oxidoreductase [Caloramator quimbayensis]SKA78671.1 dTDP-4-dehydrorhamnose reductase [Caloramator quimbayensis]
MKKILLTGGLGFFCTRFFERYKNEYEILSTDKDDLNITDEEKVYEAFEKFRPDYVIHAAAIAVTDFCNKNPEIARKINVEGAVNVAKASRKYNSKLLFISTEQVFNGNMNSGPYTEEDIPVPNTVYGQNKLEAEKLLKDILDELWVVRFTWLFGMPERNKGIASNILWETISSLIKGEKIYASPHEFRGMTYVYDMIENIVKVFDIPYGTYHIGSTNDMSRYDVVKHILTEMGLHERIDEILVKDEEKYKDAPRDVRLNTEKIKKCGIEFPTTKEAISKCIKEYKLYFK